MELVTVTAPLIRGPDRGGIPKAAGKRGFPAVSEWPRVK